MTTTNDLQDLGDLVKENLERNPDESIGEGAQTQADLDQKNLEKETETPALEVVPAEGIKSPEAPTEITAPTPVAAGDSVEGDPPTPITPEGSSDLATQLDSIFPGQGYKNLDDLKEAGIADRLSKADQAAIKNKELEETQTDLQNKLSQKLSPYANEEIAELNAFTKETGNYDPSLFHKLKHSDVENMDALDVLAMEMESNPNVKNLSRTDIEAVLKDEFKLQQKDFTHIEDEDDRLRMINQHQGEQKIAQTRLEMKAGEARGKLLELKGKIKPVDLKSQMEAQELEMKEKVENMSKEWTPHITKSIDGKRQYAIEVPGENGLDKLSDFEVPTDKLESYQEQAMQFAINNSIPTSEEGLKAVNEFIENMVLIDHKQQIIQKAVNAAKAGMESKVEREYSNTTGEKLPPVPNQATHEPQVKTTDDREEEAFSGAMKQLKEGDW